MHGKGKAISLTSLYYFHQLHRHFGISWVITELGTGLELGTFSFWAQVANHYANWYIQGALQKKHLIATFQGSNLKNINEYL